MKRFLSITFALVGMLFSVACESTTNDGSSITITSPTEVTVSKHATEFTIDYSAEAMAEVTLSSEWLRVRQHDTSVADGVTKGEIIVQVESNETGGTRMAAVTLKSGAQRSTVVVNQLGTAEEATITITSDEEINIERTGCKVTIAYTLEGRNPEDKIYVKSDADWIYSMETQTEGMVELGIATNTTGKARETEVTIGYGTAEDSVILRQAGDGDIVFNAPLLTGEYLGDALTPGIGNYWFFLSDRGFDSDGNSLPNTTYYRIDAYGPISLQYTNIPLPNGTYTFDAENTCAEWTFTAEYSGFWVTDANARREKINPFESGTLKVEDGKVTLEVKIDGVEHTAIYEGNVELTDGRGQVTYYSTLDADYTADLSDHYLLYDCYGDYYDYGAYNWMILIAPNSGVGDCIQLDFITGYNNEESGFFGDYKASDYLAKWSFIPGWSNQQQLNCSWYFTVDQSEVAPFRNGDMSIKDNGDGTITVEFEVQDDRKNTITGSWTGVAERYEEQ